MRIVEMKWFGQDDVYEVVGIRSYILGGQCQVLVKQWKGRKGLELHSIQMRHVLSGGRVWNAVSSRVVSIRLKQDNQAARPLIPWLVCMHVHIGLGEG